MNIELARTFLEVVACGSLARAADRLNVTHSTVTMRIKTLEEMLRRRVLIRNKTGVTMTAEGIRFHGFAEALVRTWQMTRRHMSLAAGFNGILSIGADSILWEDMMFEWVCKTRRSRPEIAIRSETGTAEHLMQRLFQGWLDACIVYEPRARTGFTTERLFEDPLVLASTDDRDLREKWDPEYIDSDWDEGYQRQVEQLWGQWDDTPHVSTDSAALTLRFVMEFGGSVIIPKRRLENTVFPRKLYLVHGSPTFDRTAYLVYSEENLRERVPKMSAVHLKETILSQFRGDADIWAGAKK